MGTWGVTAFDNDEACDWALHLESVDDLSLIDSTLARIENSPNRIKVRDGYIALGACEVLARLRGNHPYTSPADDWVASHPLKPSIGLLERASAVIDRILSENSEVRDLWNQEPAYLNQWIASVENLRQRLG
jgi:Domain of unknown function (DUF4259)